MSRRYWSVITPMPAALIAALAKQSEDRGVEGCSRRKCTARRSSPWRRRRYRPSG